MSERVESMSHKPVARRGAWVRLEDERPGWHYTARPERYATRAMHERPAHLREYSEPHTIPPEGAPHDNPRMMGPDE